MENKIRLYTVDSAREWAFEQHEKVGQRYGKDDYLPYSYHLTLVATIAQKYITFIPEEDRDLVLAACYLHDTLEDCHVSYNDLKSKFDTELAEIVYALTNEKGRTRRDRANDAYYKGIRETKYATFVKLCDRLANVLFSCMFGSGQFEMYKKENKHFLNSLKTESKIEEIMQMHLVHLFNTKEFGFEPHL